MRAQQTLSTFRWRATALLLLLALLAACSGPATPTTTTAPTVPPVAAVVNQTAQTTAQTAAQTTSAPATTQSAPSPATSQATTAQSALPPAASPTRAGAATPSGTPRPATATARATGTRGSATPATAGQRPKPNTSGDRLLDKHRLVTYYGHPYSDKMGILGEYDPEPMMARLKQQTAAYTAADPSRPAICTIELIASVAQGSAGADGLWLLRTPTEEIETYAKLAEKHDCLLLLDIQMGYDSVANEVQALLPFLKRPYVHLAIDPEFHMKPGEIPGEDYGSVSAADVMGAARVLADLVVQHNIPDKVLVIHQFRHDMLPDKENITPIEHVQMVIMMDGWGGPTAKIANYGAFVRDEPLEYGGIKMFYRQDDPVLTPQQVVELEPPPVVVIYQ